MGYLKETRLAAGKSAKEMYEALEVDRITYWRYENGKIPNIPFDKILKLKEILGIDIEELIKSREK